jgi:hypothetical protein
MPDTYYVTMVFAVADSEETREDVEQALRDLASERMWQLASLMVVED